MLGCEGQVQVHALWQDHQRAGGRSRQDDLVPEPGLQAVGNNPAADRSERGHGVGSDAERHRPRSGRQGRRTAGPTRAARSFRNVAIASVTLLAASALIGVGVYHEAVLRAVGLKGPSRGPRRLAGVTPKMRPKAPVAGKVKGDAARKEDEVARRRREKVLAEYTTLASILSWEYVRNEQVVPTKKKMEQRGSMLFASFHDELPRIRALLGSENATVREVCGSILKSHAVTELYASQEPLNYENFMKTYRRALVSADNRNPLTHPLTLRGGELVNTQSDMDRNDFNNALGVLKSYRVAEQNNRAYGDALEFQNKSRKRLIFSLAREFGGPVSAPPAGLHVSAQVNSNNFITIDTGRAVTTKGALAARVDSSGRLTLVSGNNVKDFFRGTHCITLTNSHANLTNCLLYLIIRRRGDRLEEERVEDISRLATLGPPFGVEEFTNAMTRPGERTYRDDSVFFYVRDLKKGDRVRIELETLNGEVVTSKLESLGLLLFSDQMTVALDPNPSFQILRNYYISALEADPQSFWSVERGRVLEFLRREAGLPPTRPQTRHPAPVAKEPRKRGQPRKRGNTSF